MKNCLVISTSEETYPCPASESREEIRLWLHIYCPLAELRLNHCGFSLPLRNRTEILAAAQQKQIPILHYDPETFETIRENIPGKWITYEDRITESDVDDFFSDND